MPQQARVRLAGTNPEDLDDITDDVSGIANKTGVELSGPVPLPTKTLEVPTRKSPDGEGTATWESIGRCASTSVSSTSTPTNAPCAS